MVDYHIHTHYSGDSKMTLDEACKKAIEMNLTEIAVTDHMDVDWPYDNYKFEIDNIEPYLEELEKANNKYPSLKVKKGIEIGLQPHVLDKCENIVIKYPFDFIIASVHIIDSLDPYYGEFYKNRTVEQFYERYYREILKLIKQYNNFDVLGHLDYVKRYSPYEYEQKEFLYCRELVEEILNTLINKNKGIEINTSGYRHKSNCTMPHPEVVKIYKNLGGQTITIGSDAHGTEHIAFNFDKAQKELKKAGFKYISVFNKRQENRVFI